MILIRIALFIITIMCTLLPTAAPVRACDYAKDSSPIDAYLDAETIFIGKADDTGIEIHDKHSVNFTLFRVEEFMKGPYEHRIRIYHDKEFKGVPKNSSGLVVAMPGDDGKPFMSDCTLPYYNYKVPPGKSLYEFHQSVLRKLHLIILLTTIFASFLFFLIIKARSLPQQPPTTKE